MILDPHLFFFSCHTGSILATWGEILDCSPQDLLPWYFCDLSVFIFWSFLMCQHPFKELEKLDLEITWYLINQRNPVYDSDMWSSPQNIARKHAPDKNGGKLERIPLRPFEAKRPIFQGLLLLLVLGRLKCLAWIMFPPKALRWLTKIGFFASVWVTTVITLDEIKS